MMDLSQNKYTFAEWQGRLDLKGSASSEPSSSVFEKAFSVLSSWAEEELIAYFVFLVKWTSYKKPLDFTSSCGSGRGGVGTQPLGSFSCWEDETVSCSVVSHSLQTQGL